MKKDKKRKLIAMKLITILLLSISLASVSFACAAYAEATQPKKATVVVYEEVDGGLEKLDEYTKKLSPQEFQKQIERARSEE